jgi:hypothetical protein
MATNPNDPKPGDKPAEPSQPAQPRPGDKPSDR